MRRLPEEGEKVMELIFRKHYAAVCHAVYRILPEPAGAEDIAQEVFLELWRRRHTLQVTSSLSAYLRRASVNKALNAVRDRRVVVDDDSDLSGVPSETLDSQGVLEAEELNQLVNDSINALPEKCRLVFVLSRFENMSYAEIADRLQISPKTVENQISKALRTLRQLLGPYLGCVLLYLYSGGIGVLL
jgi:RNA polymerase sigma-70 factor (ECF subfamily)